ncbi:hypothetical protein YA23_13325 [Klebsiella aerogenes]|nr:hypothetical protein YA23_13325 [Klebsiella aerogenes]
MHVKTAGLPLLPTFNGDGDRAMALIILRIVVRHIAQFHPGVRVGGPGNFCRQPRAPDIWHHHAAEAATAAVGIGPWSPVAVHLHRNDGVWTVVIDIYISATHAIATVVAAGRQQAEKNGDQQCQPARQNTDMLYH